MTSYTTNAENYPPGYFTSRPKTTQNSDYIYISDSLQKDNHASVESTNVSKFNSYLSPLKEVNIPRQAVPQQMKKSESVSELKPRVNLSVIERNTRENNKSVCLNNSNMSILSLANKGFSTVNKPKNRVKSVASTARRTESKSFILNNSLNVSQTARLSDVVNQKTEERLQVGALSSKMNEAAMSSRAKRKEIEDQVALLENRINRLKKEEDEMMRKIAKTNEKTQITLMNKKRKQEDLNAKLLYKEQKEEEMRKLREKIANERKSVRSGVRQAQLNTYRSKHNAVLDAKLENYNQKLIKEEIKKRVDDRNQTIIKTVNDMRDQIKSKKLGKETTQLSKVITKCAKQMDCDSQMLENLNKKYQHLAELEQVMLDNLGKTYDMHKSKIMELEEVFTMKVEPNVERRKSLAKKGK